MASTWTTTEDIDRDLCEYSDIEYDKEKFVPAPPKSIAEYRARTSRVKNPGLFDVQEHNTVGVFLSGRGKYQKDRIITPGEPVDTVPEDDFIIQKKIRSICGFAHRNEVIERAFGRKTSDLEEDEENIDADLVAPQLKLVPSGSTLSSKNGSPEHENWPPLDQTLSDNSTTQEIVDISNEIINLDISSNNSSENELNKKGKSKKKKKFKQFPCDIFNSSLSVDASALNTFCRTK